MSGSDYYIPSAVLLLALLVKSPSLWRSRHDPMSRAIFVILVTTAAGFGFGAPPTVQRVNSLTGITNVSAPLVYSILSVFACASLVLLINWRGGPEAVIRRHTRLWMAATAAAITAFAVLFSLSDVPDERPRDLDTYYANTPFIREMIVLYLASHTTISIVVITKCLRWTRELAAGWTRRGLLFLVTGYAFTLVFALLKALAVAARWAGTDSWDALSTDIAPPFTASGAGLITLGFLLPVIGPGLDSTRQAWRSYRAMEPLWRALEPWSGIGKPLRISMWSTFELRAVLRATEISDRLVNLTPSLTAEHRATGERYAARQGLTDEDSLIAVEAATIHAALAGVSPARLHGTVDPAAPAWDGDAASPIRVSGIDGLTELSLRFARIRPADLAAATAAPVAPVAPAAPEGT
ncbi:MAB_1171c family putative transporter [Streptomyces sp. NPDC048606]|uniref:MAB_1171c family putative transporter n=1 Tax=Streptomyces sp. NPDC048606 TaxID=3154726 RepID=UPI00342BE898